MAAAAPIVNLASAAPEIRATDISSIKAFAESVKISALPSTYKSLTDPRDREVADELSSQIPVIDFSLLLSDDPQLHAKGVRELGKACEEWGFFMVISNKKLRYDILLTNTMWCNVSVHTRVQTKWAVFVYLQIINHGIPEKLIDDVMSLSQKFHNMSVEEKAEFADKGVSTPIRCGTSFQAKVENVHYWRDYLKIITHPQWAFPHKPEGFQYVQPIQMPA